MKEYVQCDLFLLDGDAKMTCWLEKTPSLKEGVRITLKDYGEPLDYWRVNTVYETTITQEDLTLQRKKVFLSTIQ